MQIKQSLTVLVVAGLCATVALAAEASTGSSATGSTSSSSSSSTSTGSSGSRQGIASAITGSGIISALSSLLPSAMSSILPVVLLFGLGTLMVPAFGLGMLLREGRRSDYNVQPNLAYATPHNMRNGQLMPGNLQAQPNSNAQQPNAQAEAQSFHYYRSFPSLNFNSAMVLEVLEKVMKALDNAEKKYN